MEENKLLAELRAQRELIRNHLKWLDRQIGDMEGQVIQSADSESNDKTSTKGTAHNEPTTGEPGEIKLAPQPDAEQSEQESEYRAESWFSSYKAPEGNDILKAKIGCFVLFALSSLLFLFLLFGLPYIMN